MTKLNGVATVWLPVNCVADHDWGRIAAFRDPDGNALQLYIPPK